MPKILIADDIDSEARLVYDSLGTFAADGRRTSCVEMHGKEVKVWGLPMEDSKTLDEVFTEDGPEFEVWNHLYSGLDFARQEYDSLSERARAVLERFGEQFFSKRDNMVLSPDDQFVGLSKEALAFPWLKFAADIAIAEEVLDRATRALDRYVQLQPILTRYKLGDLVAKYLREAGRTFLFSFDAACVTFCSAALEQTLRDALVDAGVTTRHQLQRERPTASTLLAKARQAKLLVVNHRDFDRLEPLASKRLA